MQEVKESPRSKIALFFAWLGGAIAWSLFHVIGYAVASVGCTLGATGPSLLGLSQVAWLVLLVTIILALVALAALLVSRREWSRGKSKGEGEPDGGDRGVSAFTGFAGIVLNGFFLALILYAGAAALVLRPCV